MLSTLPIPLLSGLAWLPVVDAVVKASILLAAAGLLSVVLRHASAATRHMIWTLALGGALALPVLSLALPRWQVPVVTFAAPQAVVTNTDVGSGAVPREAPPLSRRPPADRDVARAASVVTAAPPATRERGALSWTSLVFLMWSIGVAAVLARVALGVLAVTWISRRTAPADAAPWLGLARSLASAIGVSPRVRFLRSPRASMPMAWGLVRPVVLMPADADEWPADRLRIVLLHELAHVKRRDCLTHLLAQIACACYWFNPLAWMAARHVRRERERACDDLVLASGTRGSDYAEELLEIARTNRAERFSAVLAGASLAMAHRSQLEGRLMAILDPSVPRSGMSRVRLTVAATLAACALLPLATLQAWSFAAERTPAPEGVVLPAPSAAPAPTPQPTPAPARAEAAPQSAEPRTRQQSTDDDLAVVGTLVNTIVNTLVNSNVNVDAKIDAMVNTHVATNVTPHVQTVVTPHVQTMVTPRVALTTGGHAGKHGDDLDAAQDSKRAPADPRMVAALTAALKDTDADVRETALHALVQLRDPAVFEPLLLALKDAAADVREQAAFGLGQLRDRRAVEPLVAALKDAAADVREQVVFALGQMRDVSTVPGLTIALHDADADVREQAAFALGQIRDPRAVEPLISALKDANPDVRQQAAFALGQLRDSRAVEALVIALKDAKDDVREQAAFALGQIRDPRAIDGLTTALKDPSADVRQQAAFALGQLVRSR